LKKIGEILTVWKSVLPPSDILITSSLFVKKGVFKNGTGIVVLPNGGI